MKRFLIIILTVSMLFLCSCNKEQSSSEQTDTDNSTEENTALNLYGYKYMSAQYEVTENEIKAPKAEKATSRNPVYSAAIYEENDVFANCAMETELNLKSAYSRSGIAFDIIENGDGSFSGYAVLVSYNKVSLNKIYVAKNGSVNVNEIFFSTMESLKSLKSLKLRIEITDNVLRLYVIDENLNGLTPWPEMETRLSFTNGGKLVGYIDDGLGSSFGKISVLPSDCFYGLDLTEENKLYQNPVIQDYMADPQVIYWEGKYYLYSTNSNNGVKVYESEDLVTWTDKGLCLDNPWPEFDKGNSYWAPEVAERNGKFYMVFTKVFNKEGEQHSVKYFAIATSDSPTGPFIAPEEPLMENCIDGHIFFDDDGRVYLYYFSYYDLGKQGIFGCELNSDLTAVIEGSKVWIMSADKSWEKNGEPVVEGPSMLKHNGVYYLTYSGSHYATKEYAVGYATSSSPLGEFKKYDNNPILSQTSEAYGTGHHSFIKIPDTDEIFIVYHRHTPWVNGKYVDRQICIDRVRFVPTENGIDRLEVYGPTTTPQKYPGQ